jgi:hypothetical protein
MEESFFLILKQNIEAGLVHRDYKRVIEVKEFATKIATGKGQFDDITRYRPSEDDDLKAQRNNLYNTLTKYVLARPRKYWQKVGRVQGIKINVTASDETKLGKLKVAFNRFSEGKDLLAWLNWKLESLGVTDPNAWVIYERYDRRNPDNSIAATNVYPFIVPCEKALNWDVKFSVLNWLFICADRAEYSLKNKAYVNLKDFTIYYPGGNIVAREVGDSTILQPGEQPIDFLIGDKPTTYYVKAYDTGTMEVPAMRVGAYTDDQTDQRTFVTWFDPAEQVFQDLMRDKMISDVLRIVHAFPKEYEYTGQCMDRHPKYGECERGYYGNQRDPEHKCASCHGSGMVTFNSEQIIAKMALPKNPKPDQLLDLSKLRFTHTLPIDFAKWVDDQVLQAEKRVMFAVFNGGVVERAIGGSATATEKNYEYEDVYDVLTNFADVEAHHFELAYRIGGNYMEIADLQADLMFPKDFKMKTAKEILADLEAMKTAGVGYDEQLILKRQLLDKLNEDNPENVAEIVARMGWLPFSDKSEVEVAQILAARSPLDNMRVLRENWLEIFREIEAEEKTAFHLQSFDMQKKVVQKKVDEFKTRILLAGQDATPQSSMDTPVNSDQSFVAMMIPHHQSAIDAAKQYLPFAKNQTLEKMAKDIISGQASEIDKMKSLGDAPAKMNM